MITTALRQCPVADSVPAKTVNVPARKVFIRAGEAVDNVLVLNTGWMFSYLVLPDGKRQVFSVFTAGDVLGGALSLSAGTATTISTLTECEVSVIDRETLFNRVLEQQGGRELLLSSIASGHNMGDQRVLELGRFTAYERLCSFILRIANKMHWQGDGGLEGFELPVTREIIADFLGLTPVHVSRTIRQLETDGVILWARGRIWIRDWQRLERGLPYLLNIKDRHSANPGAAPAESKFTMA